MRRDEAVPLVLGEVTAHELAGSIPPTLWAQRQLQQLAGGRQPYRERQAFVKSQGLDSWHDQGASWNDRGTEHAAEIIAWGLNETSRPPGGYPTTTRTNLTNAYHQLTNTDPITK